LLEAAGALDLGTDILQVVVVVDLQDLLELPLQILKSDLKVEAEDLKVVVLDIFREEQGELVKHRDMITLVEAVAAAAVTMVVMVAVVVMTLEVVLGTHQEVVVDLDMLMVDI
jgi:hypothetical protein